MNDNLIYAVRSLPPIYFAGRIASGEQALLGWLADSIVIFRFNNTGDFLGRIEEPLTVETHSGLGPEVETAVAKQIKLIRDRLGFHQDVIRVRPFFVDDLQAGIKPLPEDLEAFVENPGAYSNEDADIFREDIDSWQTAGNCVLWWGNNYHLDHEGYTL